MTRQFAAGNIFPFNIFALTDGMTIPISIVACDDIRNICRYYDNRLYRRVAPLRPCLPHKLAMRVIEAIVMEHRGGKEFDKGFIFMVWDTRLNMNEKTKMPGLRFHCRLSIAECFINIIFYGLLFFVKDYSLWNKYYIFIERFFNFNHRGRRTQIMVGLS